MANVGVGIDISKDWLDVATTVRSDTWRVPNDASGLEQLVEQLAGVQVHRVVLEASGGYEGLALLRLHAAGLPVVLIEPLRARHFAKAIGRRAKTDVIDARVLASMASLAVGDTPLWEPLDDVLVDLHALVNRRQQLLQQRDAEQKRLTFARDIVRAEIEAGIASIKTRIKDYQRRIEALVSQDARLVGELRLLQAVDGVGLITAATLRVTVPELGTLTRQEVAALVGVAPMNRDSGSVTGQRYVQGGRASARQSLYMAALAATKWNPVIQAFYARLRAAGKKPKVAIVACMRKLLIHLNGLMRTHLATRSSTEPAAQPA